MPKPSDSGSIASDYRGANRENDSLAKGTFIQRLFSILFMLPAWFAPHTRLRVFFHRLRGAKIGNNVEIGYFVILDNVHPHLVVIEDDCVITARVSILSHDNSYYYTHGLPVKIGQTTIRQGAFIGIGAVILPTLTVGELAIVGPNSVVTRDVVQRAVVAGIPAKEIKRVESKE